MAGENTEKGGLLSMYQAKLWRKINGQKGIFLYRGQKYAGWELQSGAVDRIGEESIQSRTLIEYHNNLLESARLRGWNRDSNGRELEDLELLAKLQHYGAATCLLDFTTRFDIALWFACQEVSDQEINGTDKKRKGKIFIFNVDQNLQSGLGKVRSDELKKEIGYFLCFGLVKVENDEEVQQQENDQELEEGEDKIRFWYWEPETLMGRMLSQESRFLFGSQDIPKNTCFCIEIDEEHKEGLLGELRCQQGLHPETVFSDIHGFASINARGKPWKIKNYMDYIGAGVSKLLERDEAADAVQNFNKAIKLNPDRFDAWIFRGLAKRSLGMYEEAIKDFDEGINLNEKVPLSWSIRGLAKSLLERYEDAISDYDEAIKLGSHDGIVFFRRGIAKMKLGLYKAARSDMETARVRFFKSGDLKEQRDAEYYIEKLDRLLEKKDEFLDSEQNSI